MVGTEPGRQLAGDASSGAPPDTLDPREAARSLDELREEVMAMDVSVSAAAYERLDAAALMRRRGKLKQAQLALSVRMETAESDEGNMKGGGGPAAVAEARQSQA